MKTFILLLRGINVAGKNRLHMKDLVSILDGLGCSDVKTYIQSGNVVLKSSASAVSLQDSVQNEIEKVKGFSVSVFAIPLSQFKLAVENCPFEVSEGKQLHYYFTLSAPESLNVELLESVRSETEQYALKGFVFYLFAPNGLSRSKLAQKVEQALGVPATARNANTIKKLVALAG